MEGAEAQESSAKPDFKERFDLLFKYIIIGDTSVGKSCVLHHYLRNKCTPFPTHNL